MQTFQPSELKALFGQLVAAVGTQDAAAVYLGISRQRVGQLVSAHPDHAADLPTWGQVFCLEQVAGVSVVFGALARRVETRSAADALTAGLSAAVATSQAVQTLHEITADGEVTEDEAKRAERDALRALEAAQRQYDATRAVRPTRPETTGGAHDGWGSPPHCWHESTRRRLAWQYGEARANRIVVGIDAPTERDRARWNSLGSKGAAR